MWTGELKVRRVEGEISTDDIIPARYKHRFTDPALMAPHVFENRLPGLAATFRPGDALVSRDIFGIGSSREQAVSALLAAGVRLVVAPEFGRIFYRNCWNLGLPAVEAAVEAAVETEKSALPAEGARVALDLTRGRLTGPGVSVPFRPPAPMMIEMVRAGGLLPLVFARTRPPAAAQAHQDVEPSQTTPVGPQGR
ncbi:hypothetical protein [Streptacidiphilus sp. EB129]|uniref:LeuD/DmdB family oxidoreductase small subunit n=1 Tax=Streptacidiphilus sp. EB129 TaxID=3156262 RepID=UPI003512BB02